MNFFPGDSTGIRGNASQINTAKAPMFGWHSALFWSNLFTGWTGSDADAAKSAIDTDHQALIDAEHNYGHCADALNTFAGQLDACNAQYVKDYNAYQAALAAISPDDPNAAAEQQAAAQTFWQACRTNIANYNADVSVMQRAAITAANGASPYGGGGPWATDTGATSWKADTDNPDDFAQELIPLNGQVDMSDAGLDPLTVSQEQAGDCWFLSAIMSLECTEAGKDWLRQHCVWDAKKGGYNVSLFVDGKWQTYFVNQIADDGAGAGSGTLPNVASVYEEAMRQATNWQGENGETNTDGTNMITGDNSANTSADAKSAAAAFNNGDSVTAATAGKNTPSSADYRYYDVQVQEPDGSTQTASVGFVDGHAYAVVGTEPNGDIIVRNPWGPGNSADGGGNLVLTPSQYDQIFAQQGASHTK